MVYIQKFLTEDDVNYYKSKSDETIKSMIKDKFGNNTSMKEYMEFPDGDVDELLKQFREENFTEYRRIGRWRCPLIKVLNINGEIKYFSTRTAQFRYVNKWNQESSCSGYTIIMDSNNKVLWIGSYYENEYFLSHGDSIYLLGYEHKDITLFPNISDENEYFDDENESINDELIRKYTKNIRCYRYSTIDKAHDIFEKEKIGVSISIEEYFEKGFFHKGFKWNLDWQDYLYPNDISILTAVSAKDNLFYIDIVNITYPHCGYVVLDLKNMKIVEAKKL